MSAAARRLYYDDSYLAEFRARVTDRGGDGSRLVLDRTAFYPASGGQPHDLGTLGGVPVIEVVEEDDRVVHVTSAPIAAEVVEGRIDWPRRFDHMQQHSGQHLLSAAILDLCGIPTVSFHLGEESSTIEIQTAALEAGRIAEIEWRANDLVVENRPIAVSYEPAVDAGPLRVPSSREGLLRIVAIRDLDRIACGGTHVRATGEIGPVLLRKTEKIRGNMRLEFLCGGRAVRRARADFDALSRIARSFSAPLDDAPALVSSQTEALREAERARQKLAAELAAYQGRELYDSTPPDAAGMRRVLRRLPSGSLDDELRGLARGFTARPKAVFVAALEQPPSILLTVSSDAGIHAGDVLKAALSRCGGRGGGTALMAQGSLPSRDLLDSLLGRIQWFA